MKMNLKRLPSVAPLLLLSLALPSSLSAADRTWTGAGGNDFWSTPANWGGNSVVANDSLLFGGSVRTTPNNDFPVGTIFGGITILNPAGAFTIRGNGITLGGTLADDMPLVPQTIQFPIALNAPRNISVAADGALTLSGVVSGPGTGIIKTGAGQLTLAAANTFSGPIRILGGTLSVGADNNLGVAPGSPTAGRIVIDSGALRATSTFTLSANRGIALGPTSGNGAGTFWINSGTTLSYSGAIANNGGSGGLTKSAFGGLTLSGANTYTGPTVIENGTLTLDFTQTGSPVNNVISGSSALVLGGGNAGLGAASFDALTINGKAAVANSQTFNGTTIQVGPAIIRANSGVGGSANVTLGALAHNPGGILNLITPTLTGGAGAMMTTTPNTHGILGGWATVGNGGVYRNITMGTEWASVDGGGNIVPYTGYAVYSSGQNLHSTATADTNLRINSTSSGDVIVDTPAAGTVTDVNTINLSETRPFSLVIGDGNTLRLGQYGSIFKSDNANNITWVLGSGTSGGGNGLQNSGTLTAGGAPDAPGEIVFYMNNNASQSQGSLNVECKVSDNGAGAVSVVKAGPGSMKLRGRNTFSGGLFLLQGRLQLAGGEIGTANPDGAGTGPIHVYPGAYLFPSGTGSVITNDCFVAGLGTDQEQVGAIRFGNGWSISGNVVLRGDTRLGGGSATTVATTGISGKIGGPYNLDIGALGTINSFMTFWNPANDWTGNTTLNARNNVSLNVFRNGASEVLPHGTGKGNVTMNGNTSTGTISWDLNGFNETVNGLLAVGNLVGCVISNTASGTTSTLTVGDYDQSATFGGTLQGGGGVLALTKIGGGKQTLTGVNTYNGVTTVNAGTLALSGAGSIANSSQIIVNSATFDVSELASGFAYGSIMDINGGTFVVRNTTAPGVNTLNVSDARVRVAGLGSVPVVADVTSLNTGGTANYIDIGSIGTVAAYPAKFTIIKYAGTIGGNGFNFQLGNVPTPSTAGYVTNNEANSSIDLVLLDGPKPLTWTGALSSNWDIDTTPNWLAFGITPSVYLDVDSARFDDGGVAKTVNITTGVQPGAVIVNNTASYSFTGPGKISGPTGLTKDGTGTLILENTGTNDFFGLLAINGGTVQLGNNNTAGSLGAGRIENNAGLAFSRTDDVTVANQISGSAAGTITQNGPGLLTISGDNTFTGAVVVAQSTLKVAHAAALGTTNATTINAGATLDVNGISLATEAVIVSGSGVGDRGAIVNTGSDQQSALRMVTLAGDATFGGSARWDIRNTGGDAYLDGNGGTANIVKVGPNQVSLVGVNVYSSLGEIDIREGTFSIQTTTSQVGDPFSTLTVHNGARLGLFNLNTTPLNKIIILQDGGILFNENGRSIIEGSVTSEGTATINAANAGTTPALVINHGIDGPGGITKTGAGALVLAGPSTYGGPTTVNQGTLIVDGAIQSSPITVSGGTLAGSGSIASAITIGPNGTLAPGNLNVAIGALTIDFQLTLQGTTSMDVNKVGGSINNDLVAGFSAITFGGTLRLNLTGEPLAAGDAITLFSFGSSQGGSIPSIVPATPGPNLKWDTSRLTVDGSLHVESSAPEIGTITVSGSDVVINGTGGTPGGSYSILTSTDVTLPANQWTPATTGTFDASGNFNFSTAIETTTPQRYFRVSIP